MEILSTRRFCSALLFSEKKERKESKINKIKNFQKMN